ncbi:hypothetical protein IVB18_45545 [Bradyrhizobium sp. 186]|uniref:hypothetical protein n=1 Tax=Bradyrhizobium sp. 186 TaxID=2782654 RepID=UPI002000D07B|nr:hypothetical protein [Bradyrhizobium sp. 186]UPK35163.1 hypothetical protein IVB18_45545 [Bradyrhizobium sp. 186]
MTKADSVHSTPPLNSSPIQAINPPPHALAEPRDSFSSQHAIGQRENGQPTSESRKPAEGLSRRNMLGAMAVLPATLPTVATATADPIFAAIERHRAARVI